jgi:hypothetical protein
VYRIILVVTLFAAVCTNVLAESPPDNLRLSAIFKEDQQARQKAPIDWTVVAAQDKAHRTEVLGLLKSSKLRTANDYYRAAMVFQHGEELEDIRLAFSLSQLSATLDPAHKQARWLSAASWDRILMTKNVPQWYGTQYYQPSPGAPTELYKTDESVISDAERASMNVPSLQAAKDLLREINQ